MQAAPAAVGLLEVFGRGTGCAPLEYLEQSLTVGTSAVRVVTNNPRAVALMLSVGGTGSVTLGRNPALAAGQGILVNASTSPVILTDRDMPGAAGLEWYAIGSATGLTLWSLRIAFAA